MPLDFITIAITSLSLIATIVGWSITYNYQKKLLHIQVSAEKQKTIMQFSIPYKLEQIKRIKEWKAEGISMYLQLETIPNKDVIRNEMKAKADNWGSEVFSELIQIAALLDPIDERIKNGQDLKRDLSLLLAQFQLLYTVKIRNGLFGSNDNNFDSTIDKYGFAEFSLEEELVRIEKKLLQ